ncbi:MAG: hypothetical protein SV765_17535 [Pseudomonadota bacterium]|nr:hypothetical protein [Pseudomonadota bacterium]
MEETRCSQGDLCATQLVQMIIRQLTSKKGANPVDINTSRKLSNKKITGQGMSEYLVIVGLLAVAGIAAMGFMGGSVRQTMSAFAAEFSGNDSGSFRDEALSSATEAQDNAVAGLDNYEENNNQISN